MQKTKTKLLRLPFLKAFAVYSILSYLPKTFAQWCIRTNVVLKNLFLLSFTFLFACKCSTPIICCFCCCVSQPVAASCVCVTYSPRLYWLRMNGPWKLQMFRETLAVDMGSFRINTIFNSSCSTNSLPQEWKRLSVPQGALFHLSGGLSESQAMIHLILVIKKW